MFKTKLGDFELHVLTSGFIRLDGGAMFGAVPKMLWEKTNPADDKNRILLAMNILLVRTGRQNILIDTGIGNKGDEKFNAIFGVEGYQPMDRLLGAAGLKTSDIDIVINTHLHFDHAGGNTIMDSEGRYMPAFPNARYIIQKGELDDAIHTNERTKASYRRDDFLPLRETGAFEFVDGDRKIAEGVMAIKTPGHNRNHQCVLLESADKKAFYLGDLVPTASHIPFPYIMGYDLFPLETLENKKRILNQAADEGWLLIFEHDPKIKTGYLKRDGYKLILIQTQ
ncbi:MAG: MBL fold metallo-hydrolase [Nitrospirae bacterium]|nr:MBL fold metallo-hydrolase [Nitrospirota bacterium]